MALTQVTKEFVKNIDPSQLTQSGALNGQFLKYSTTTNRWEPGTGSGGGGGSGNPLTINGASLAKAWVNFSGTKDTTGADSTSNTNRLIKSSYNVSSVERTGEGLYRINFSTGTFTDTNYVYTFGVKTNQTNPSSSGLVFMVQYGNKTQNYIEVECDDQGSSPATDFDEICVVFYGQGGDITGSVVDNTPVGIINWFASKTPPTGYLECNGSAILRTSYPDLDTAMYCGDASNGTAGFGYRCTSNTNPTGTRNTTGQYIVLPNLQGEFIRGWDNGKGTDAGRAFGSSQKGSVMVFDCGTDVVTRGLGVDNSSSALTNMGYDAITNLSDYTGTEARDIGSVASPGVGSVNSEGGWGVTRPRNVALLPCIKAEKTLSSSSVINSSGNLIGFKVYNTPGTYSIPNTLIPDSVRAVKVTLIGGGGGGGGNGAGATAGGSSSITINGITVTAGGGSGGNGTSYSGSAGGSVAAVAGIIGAAAGGAGGDNNSGQVNPQNGASNFTLGIAAGGGGGATDFRGGAGGGAGNGSGGTSGGWSAGNGGLISFNKFGILGITGGDGSAGGSHVNGANNAKIGFGGGGGGNSSLLNNNGSAHGSGGGGGAFALFVIPLTGATTYNNAITVGAGGTITAGQGSDPGWIGGDGMGGLVILEW